MKVKLSQNSKIMTVKKTFRSMILAIAFVFGINSFAQNKNIVETAVSNEAFSTLVTAVKSAELVEVLSSDGPFTVFAPTNEAFAKLPEGTIATLLKPESKEALQNILKYHVVAGDVKAADVIALIKKSNGKAMIETVSGGTLAAQLKDGSVYLTDENGNWAKVTATDINQTNGVIHVIDTVVLPK
jgi:uncharacterized surface protein with fasciclin (FAS1) repeats